MALDCDYFRLGHRSQSLYKEKIGQNFLDLAENFKTYLFFLILQVRYFPYLTEEKA